MVRRTARPETRVLIRASEVLRVLAHPVRLRIIEELQAAREMTVGILRDRLGVSQSMTSQHLALLRRIGVVGRRKAGNRCHYFLQRPEVLDLLRCVRACGGGPRARGSGR